ncbi:MAG: hypothetical protein ACJ8LM_16510 [Candidatus Udaeobacter sp.]
METPIWKRYECRGDKYLVEYHPQKDGTVLLRCPEHPLNKFAFDEVITHLNHKTKSICVSKGREPRSFEAAECIAHLFMQGYSEYVRTGKSMPTGGTVIT